MKQIKKQCFNQKKHSLYDSTITTNLLYFIATTSLYNNASHFLKSNIITKSTNYQLNMKMKIFINIPIDKWQWSYYIYDIEQIYLFITL